MWKEQLFPLLRLARRLDTIPIHSMYAIYAYIGVVWGVNGAAYMAYMECMGLFNQVKEVQFTVTTRGRRTRMFDYPMSQYLGSYSILYM